ncbi:MAG: ferric reductase-like transmembrane domain-containing protein [Kofleriaceae bacterium]|nr:ferric reductase-like transmembrane domain-containing protein [Kofleriaceae bacterium]
MRRPLVVGAIVGVALLLVADAALTRAGVVVGALPRAAGPWPWVATRAAGVIAYLALTADVVFGLLVSSGAGDGWVARARSVELHRWLSSVTLALVAVHVVTLLADGFARLDVLDAVVPFASGYRPLAIGLGVLAAEVAVLVHLSFGWRKRLGARAWRRLHLATFGVFAAATAHGVRGGSDADVGWMRTIYLASIVVVALLLGARLWRSRARRHVGSRTSSSTATR